MSRLIIAGCFLALMTVSAGAVPDCVPKYTAHKAAGFVSVIYVLPTVALLVASPVKARLACTAGAMAKHAVGTNPHKDN
jgi:hypothetical protein